MVSISMEMCRNDKRAMNRRQFLQRSVLGVAGLQLPVSELQNGGQPPIGRSRSPKTVIIIGAGLAGLVSAYELTKAGHAVTLLEAQARSGGRALTLRKPFPDGLYAEAGASSFTCPSNQSGCSIHPSITMFAASSLRSRHQAGQTGHLH